MSSNADHALSLTLIRFMCSASQKTHPTLAASDVIVCINVHPLVTSTVTSILITMGQIIAGYLDACRIFGITMTMEWRGPDIKVDWLPYGGTKSLFWSNVTIPSSMAPSPPTATMLTLLPALVMMMEVIEMEGQCSDGLASQCLDEDLHTTMEMEDKIWSDFRLEIDQIT
ncbi:hypothetical protein BDN71DRAFT_1433932 [Pleurotus eryngii]|uniref:Uncharacterized protein n=1 Tax=Pleurotus eryngii TaxID=5323 RepID=A0A9P6DC80_PLEER|nr:hypothetical protein BDN71DRAFT_1433932 [Pleurotus eryngii]